MPLDTAPSMILLPRLFDGGSPPAEKTLVSGVALLRLSGVTRDTNVQHAPYTGQGCRSFVFSPILLFTPLVI